MRSTMYRIILCVIVLLMTSVMVTHAADNATNLLPNGDFSQGLDANSLPLNWSSLAAIPDGSSVSLSKEYATVGEFSMELIDASSDKSVGVRSKRVDATPGQWFVVEADVMIVSGDAMVYLDFHNEKLQRVDVKTITIRASSGWQTVSLEGIAPEGTTNVSIILYSGVANVGKVYFDNIRLYGFAQ
jgi:hypothetical protein